MHLQLRGHPIRRTFNPPGRARALLAVALALALTGVGCSQSTGTREAGTAGSSSQLGLAFSPQVLVPPPEAEFKLRLFTGPVKTNSAGQIITGPTSDPVKTLVGAEPAGERGGQQRFTKIQFGVNYMDGRPDPGSRINPNNIITPKGDQFWPFVPQPFRGMPFSVALTADGRKLYAPLPGKEGYPDYRMAVMNTATRAVKWVDLRPSGVTRGLRPIGVAVSPANPTLYKNPYVVVLNQYANFATVVDTGNDAALGTFETGFYGEDLVFNSNGTRLYLTDRFKDEVRAFKVDPGPVFTRLAEIPTGPNELDRANPRDLALSADGKTLYVANTLGHTVAVINVDNDANVLTNTLTVGGLVTDIKLAGRYAFVVGHATNTALNGKEMGHGLPYQDASGVFRRNNGAALGYTPVMSDATKATTFDDLGSEINVLDTTTGLFVQKYVDFERDKSQMAVPGQYTDLGDFTPDQEIIHGSGPEQVAVRGNFLFVSHMHSDEVEVFRIDVNAADPKHVLAPVSRSLTGGITPQGIAVSPDGGKVYVANMQTEDVSVLNVDANGNLSRNGYVTVGVTDKTPDPTRNGNNGQHLFATQEEIGLRWMFSSAYSDDGQKSCGFCHWSSRSDGSQWNVGANAIGGVKVCPQNKDTSDNWPEWFEGLNTDMMAYASACNGELTIAERKTPLFPQADELARYRARDAYVKQKTAANSAEINRPELNGDAYQIGYEKLAYSQILWTQNETRRMPSPLSQAPSAAEAAQVARGKWLFSTRVSAGGSGCADCHHNGNVRTNGVSDVTTQDFAIHEPGVVSETTVDGLGPFYRPGNDYFFVSMGLPQDEGSRQNVSSRNTKQLRAFWDSVPRWLHHGGAHSIREILLAPDSPLLQPGERGFNFRTVRSDAERAVATDFLGGAPVVLPTEVPITFADSSGALGGDGKGPILVSLDSPSVVLSGGELEIDRLGTSNLAPLVVLDGNGQRQLNPALSASGVQVIKDTHGKTSQLSQADIDALAAYLMSGLE
jgi:DNA-binding beta-propeller fold protein YncE/cytochrome c553